LSANAKHDAVLLRGLIVGERAAFETAYHRHNASMIRVASAIMHHRASAEEITQETWIAVLRNIGGFEGRSSLAGWIFTILSNKAKTRARRDGLSVSLDTSVNDDGIDDAFDGRGALAGYARVVERNDTRADCRWAASAGTCERRN